MQPLRLSETVKRDGGRCNMFTQVDYGPSTPLAPITGFDELAYTLAGGHEKGRR